MKGLNNAIRQHWDDGVQTMPSGSALPKKHFNDLKQVKKLLLDRKVGKGGRDSE